MTRPGASTRRVGTLGMQGSMDRRRSQGDETAQEPTRARHRVRLPRFVAAEQVGLGDVVKKVTTAVGVKPCSPCQGRAERLNRWVQFVPRR
jgi:hypothetical protein